MSPFPTSPHRFSTLSPCRLSSPCREAGHFTRPSSCAEARSPLSRLCARLLPTICKSPKAISFFQPAATCCRHWAALYMPTKSAPPRYRPWPSHWLKKALPNTLRLCRHSSPRPRNTTDGGKKKPVTTGPPGHWHRGIKRLCSVSTRARPPQRLSPLPPTVPFSSPTMLPIWEILSKPCAVDSPN